MGGRKKENYEKKGVTGQVGRKGVIKVRKRPSRGKGVLLPRRIQGAM